MKFTEEKLEKADIMVNGQLLMVNESFRCQVFGAENLTNFKMSSYFSNILDKLIIFALK
jgi:hypothetical protein